MLTALAALDSSTTVDRSDAGGGIASNAVPEMDDVTLAEAGAWVDAYGQAWVNHDLEAGLALFTTGATFREARFKPAVIGQESMIAYWRARRRPQYGNSFSGETLVMRGNLALAHWTAEFTWRPTNMTYRLDAISRIALVRAPDGTIKASLLEHWIDRQLSEP